MFLLDGRQLFEEQLSQSNSFRKHINKMNFFIVGNHGKFFCEFNMENVSKKKWTQSQSDFQSNLFWRPSIWSLFWTLSGKG